VVAAPAAVVAAFGVSVALLPPQAASNAAPAVAAKPLSSARRESRRASFLFVPIIVGTSS
jgi:hypothetical protein